MNFSDVHSAVARFINNHHALQRSRFILHHSVQDSVTTVWQRIASCLHYPDNRTLTHPFLVPCTYWVSQLLLFHNKTRRRRRRYVPSAANVVRTYEERADGRDGSAVPTPLNASSLHPRSPHSLASFRPPRLSPQSFLTPAMHQCYWWAA